MTSLRTSLYELCQHHLNRYLALLLLYSLTDIQVYFIFDTLLYPRGGGVKRRLLCETNMFLSSYEFRSSH